jgi:hypothetical protein
MTAMHAILVGAAIALGLNVAVLSGFLLHFRLERRRYIKRSLASFDAEFGTVPKKARAA